VVVFAGGLLKGREGGREGGRASAGEGCFSFVCVKYGGDWERYKKEVRRLFLPGVY
jgi:hypothetical protein